MLAHYPQAPVQLAHAKIDATERKTQNVYGAMRRGRAGEASADSANQGAVGFAMKPGMRHEDAGVPARIDWTRFCASGGLSQGMSLTGFER